MASESAEGGSAVHSQTLTLIKAQEPCVLLKLLPSSLSGRTLIPYCWSPTSFPLSPVVFVLHHFQQALPPLEL